MFKIIWDVRENILIINEHIAGIKKISIFAEQKSKERW